MTRLRFVGDLPLWMGLLLAAIVAAMAWRFYRRESFNLSRGLRWLLPALRASAFFLGILILTGPVLQHRRSIDEMGQVKIYVDASQSMGLLDRHESVGRKLLIAEQQGWLPDGQLDSSLMEAVDRLSSARKQTETSLVKLNSDTPDDAMKGFRDQLLVAVQSVPTPPQNIVAQLEAIDVSDQQPLESTTADLMAACDSIRTLEADFFTEFEAQAKLLANSGDSTITAALELFDETSRWQRAQRSLLDTEAALLSTLNDNHNVEVIALQNQQGIELIDGPTTETAPDTLKHQPDARSTDLTTGIAATQKQTAVSETNTSVATLRPNTAIVLLTDGQHNSGPSPIQTARVLGGQGIAIYPVAMGATSTASDLSVTAVENPELVFRKDLVRGTIRFCDRMPAGQTTLAQVQHEGVTLWQQQVTTTGQGNRRIDFEFGIEDIVEKLDQQFDSDVARHAITMKMQAEIKLLPNEAETTNNQQMLRFAAVTQSHRMLMIDGRSRWETRYLRNAFERDSQWDVNAIIAGPGTDDETISRGSARGQFPESRDALFKYDIIVIGEIVSELLADHEYQWIREFAATKGGGIIFVDGNRERMRAFSPNNLAQLLPVEWRVDGISASPTMLQLTDKGSRTPVMAVEVDRSANQRFWNELPPPRRLNAVNALPGAEVLAEAVIGEETFPAIVTRNYGAGRILYMATDETWRWRYKAADKYHQRIWNQYATFVMHRPFAVSDEYLDLDTGSVSYRNQDSADIRVRLRGLDGQPTSNSNVDAIVWKDGQEVANVSLSLDADVPGLYRGITGALAEGQYEVSVRAPGFSQTALKARSQFVVMPPVSGELNETSCNEELLQQMATESGGVYLREEQIDQLVTLLSPRGNSRVIEPDTVLWQSYWWFSAIILLLTAEWFLRKRAGLL